MKSTYSIAALGAMFSAITLANALTLLPARATVTAGLAMTPERCRAVSAHEHLTCHNGPLANREPRVPGRPKMTAALKHVLYGKPASRTAKPSGK
jgi:hypothetical protein